ncbi:Trp biosynthesis-associated membrane protein [Haloechinothrix halophila]|uniref:Trp biosynthesis-associated membrane protein n=1 Tax=Haloechinothrix halophila TaxID=1069073 RepID=UPI00040BB5B7|nr:Trp biosynthesis-associated membrane protein [Haloechinothrix halophila]
MADSPDSPDSRGGTDGSGVGSTGSADSDGSAATRSAKRSLLVTIAVLLLGALALWGSSRLTWIEVPAGLTIDGRLADDLTGADLVTWLVRLAVLTLAAVAAVLALPGQVRRVLGVVLGAAGLVVLWLTLSGGAYDVAWSGPAPGYDVTGEPERTLAGPAAALAGAALLLAAGVLLLARGRRMPRLGAKYSAPGGKSPAKDSDDDLWRALSDGEDPTSGS